MTINNEKYTKRRRSDCSDWAVGVNVLTGAIPLLADTGTFGCSVTPSDPIHASLFNLDLSDSSNRPMLMPVLVRTPDRHTHKSKSESQSRAIHSFKPARSRITGTRHAYLAISFVYIWKLIFSNHLSILINAMDYWLISPNCIRQLIVYTIHAFMRDFYY